MTPEVLQMRLHAMIATLQPGTRPKIESGNAEKQLIHDLDCLDLMIKYFIFDREASIREAINFGMGGSDEQQEH
jgi:hypothetical protein